MEKDNFRYLKGGLAFSLEEAVEYCARPGHKRHRHALEFVYKRFYGYLFAIALRYIRNREDVEELVNESLVRAFAKLDTFTCEGDASRYEKMFRGWLGRICVHASIDFLRKKREMMFLDINDADIEMPCEATDAGERLEYEEVMGLLLRLPDIQRTIFNLYEVEGYSHEEIAGLLHIPESTSRTYLTRAKQRLRKLYMEAYPMDINNLR